MARIHETDEQRAAREAEEAEFRRLHPNCDGDGKLRFRWTIAGNGITHCGVCCPPPPLSPAQTARVAEVFGQVLRDAAARKGVELKPEPTRPNEVKSENGKRRTVGGKAAKLERLRAQAAELGMDLVPRDEP